MGTVVEVFVTELAGAVRHDDATGCTTRHWVSGTTTSWCPDGPITVIGGVGANGTLNPDGSSSRTSTAPPSHPYPQPTLVPTPKPFPEGGSMTCTSATTAGGYGRTCFYERPDGGYGVVGATGFRAIGGGGADRRDRGVSDA